MQRLGSVVVALFALRGIAVAEAPRTQKQQDADRLFAEGRDLLTNKHDAKAACERFELAATEDPTAAGTMLNLGLCYEELGKTHTALKWFRRAQTQASESGLPDHEEAAKKHTADLVTKVPVIAIVFGGATPTDPHVRIDTEQISADDLAHVELDPGDHLLEVRASHRKISRSHITIAPRDPKVSDVVEVKVALEEGEPTIVVDAGRTRRLVGIALGVVALGAWSFDFLYGIHESSQYHCAKDEIDNPMKPCSARGTQSAVDYANARVDALKFTGTTVFVVGAAALAAGAYLFFTAPGKVTQDQVGGEHVSIAPVIMPGQIGFALTGGF